MNEFVIINGVLYKYNGNESRVVIPNGVRQIKTKAFDECKKVFKIEIPNSVETISSLAFLDCNRLELINIPNNVQYIGFAAFAQMVQVKPQYNANGSLRAFKAFSKGWTCRDFQYEIGKSYHQDGEIECCWNGFHTCPNPLMVFNHYWGDVNDRRFAEVELSGKMDWEDDKVAASDIKIVRELFVNDLAEIYNSMEKV